MSAVYDRFWHRTDLPACPLYGRYWGQSGRGSDIAESTRLTHSGHMARGALNLPESSNPYRKRLPAVDITAAVLRLPTATCIM
jgi:hypothetical protein